MPTPMPTVVAKGAIALALDVRYGKPDERWDSLRKLRATFAAGTTGVSVGQTQTQVLSQQDATHLNSDWFGKDNTWACLRENPTASAYWGTKMEATYTLPELDAKDGERVVTKGLIEALEVSLGLKSDEDPTLLPGNKLDKTKLARNLPVFVYWVCGKFDGFEVQVSWTDFQVDVFIVTPPVANGVADLTKPYPNPGDKRDDAKRSDDQGMLLVTKGGLAPPPLSFLSRLMAQADGGVTSDP